eukprot:TRINITY_DN73214_c0_g1_i1.p1 TRINITY_DN73214_c0_g1~~TRINITY_DN73214_c0_g1_i1.p1  ORF type:complete len:361 (+),score=91.10 TRINITY_DN73214_c0_g1_i1:90-1172(+)
MENGAPSSDEEDSHSYSYDESCSEEEAKPKADGGDDSSTKKGSITQQIREARERSNADLANALKDLERDAQQEIDDAVRQAESKFMEEAEVRIERFAENVRREAKAKVEECRASATEKAQERAQTRTIELREAAEKRLRDEEERLRGILAEKELAKITAKVDKRLKEAKKEKKSGKADESDDSSSASSADSSSDSEGSESSKSKSSAKKRKRTRTERGRRRRRRSRGRRRRRKKTGGKRRKKHRRKGGGGRRRRRRREASRSDSRSPSGNPGPRKYRLVPSSQAGVAMLGFKGSGEHKGDLDEFISKNQLDDRTVAALQELSEDHQKHVMGTDGGANTFVLIDKVKNPSAVVMSRIRKVA